MERFDRDRMEKLRKAAGLTQKQAAERAGMTQGRWSEIESGKRVEFTVDTLAQIAKGLGCRVSKLFVDQERLQQ
jgi:transcriptional regulator with XRE-family HTH domain